MGAKPFEGDKNKPMIYLVLLDNIEKEALWIIQNTVKERFNLPVEILENKQDLSFAYNSRRRQYYSSKILEEMVRTLPSHALAALLITAEDLYVPQLNFVFGEASPYSKIAIISLSRLQPEFYGLAKDETLFQERACKEAVHELGHVFGLPHCSKKHCVMHFSNSLQDTDFKGDNFCSDCWNMFRKQSQGFRLGS